MARPMPLLPPVTSATFPRSPRSIRTPFAPYSSNEQDMHIHHIRPGRSCDQEIVQSMKKVVGIIAAQIGLWHKSQGPRPRHRRAVRQGPSGRRWSVSAIGASTQDHNAIQTRNIECRGERKFLISSSETVASNGDGRFTARQHTRRREQGYLSLPYLPHDSRMHASNVPRFSFQRRRQEQGFVAARLRLRASRPQGQAITANDHRLTARKGEIGSFRCFREFSDLPALEMHAHTHWESCEKIIALDNLQAILICCRVWHRWA